VIIRCLIILCSILLATAGFVSADSAKVGNNLPVNLADYLRNDEKLTYVVKWNGFPIGKIQTSVWSVIRKFDDKACYMLKLDVESNDFLSMFYKIRSSLSSLADVKNGWSYLYRRRAVEGGYRGNDRVVFEYNNKDKNGKPAPMAFPYLIRWEEVEELKPFELPGKICDPVTLIWYLRGIPLQQIGDSVSILLADRYSLLKTKWSVSGYNKINLPLLGSYDSIIISPSLLLSSDNKNLLDVTGQASFWLEKNTRIILRAEANLEIGQLGVTLVSEDNTRLQEFKLKSGN